MKNFLFHIIIKLSTFWKFYHTAAYSLECVIQDISPFIILCKLNDRFVDFQRSIQINGLNLSCKTLQGSAIILNYSGNIILAQFLLYFFEDQPESNHLDG